VFLSELAEELSSRGIPYCVVGGVAVNLHGVPRETYNLDIVVPPEKRSLHALEQLLAELGFRCDEAFRLGDLVDSRRRRELLHRHNLVRLRFVRSTDLLGVVVAAPINPLLLVKRSVACTVGGVQVRVAKRSDLICMKRVSGGQLDAADAARLERVGQRAH
jgi:hypothetical protein